MALLHTVVVARHGSRRFFFQFFVVIRLFLWCFHRPKRLFEENRNHFFRVYRRSFEVNGIVPGTFFGSLFPVEYQ